MRLVLGSPESNVRLLCSVVVAAVSLIALICARYTVPTRHHLNLGVCYISIDELDGDGRVVVFNDLRRGAHPHLAVSELKNGQYFLRTKTYLGGRAGFVQGPATKNTWFRTLGMEYTLHQETGLPSVWSASLSLWYPLAIGMFSAMTCIIRIRLRDRHRGFEVVDAAASPAAAVHAPR